MKTLLIVTAVIELGAGLGLVLLPSAIVPLLLGVPLDSPAALSVARVGGSGLVALSVACWIAHGDKHSRVARGLVLAMLVYNIATVVVLTHAGIGDRMHGLLLWPGVVLHTLMAIWCLVELLRNPRNAVAEGPSRESANAKQTPK